MPAAWVLHSSECRLLLVIYVITDHRIFISRTGIPSAEAVVAKALSERIVVDLELRDLFVLVGGDGNERSLVERVRVKRVPAHAEDVVRLDHVDPRLVLVHRVQNDLYTSHTITALTR